METPNANLVGAKALIHHAIARAATYPEEDEILDMVFKDPKEALSRIGGDDRICLSREEENQLITFGKTPFADSSTELAISDIIQRLVGTESRLDMVEPV